MKTITPNPTASASHTIADTAAKTPVLVITNDGWGSPSVVFAGQGVRDILPGVEDYTPEMEAQMVSENTEVAKYWSNLGILRTVDGDCYRYDARGGCEFSRGSDVIATLQEWGLAKAAARVARDIEEGSTDEYLLCTTTDGDEYIRIDSHDQGERLIIRKEDADTGDLWYYRDETGLEGGAQ